MDKKAKIYIAGHRGLVGSALMRQLKTQGYENLVTRTHEAKINSQPTVTVWGTGAPRREFLYSDDMAEGCLFLMNLDSVKFKLLLAQDKNNGLAPLMNIGSNFDLTIVQLASMIKKVTGYTGVIVFDTSKPDGTMSKLMDSGRLNNIGWSASVSLAKGLEFAYQDFLKR